MEAHRDAAASVEQQPLSPGFYQRTHPEAVDIEDGRAGAKQRHLHDLPPAMVIPRCLPCSVHVSRDHAQ
jgi:hypothetical protein